MTLPNLFNRMNLEQENKNIEFISEIKSDETMSIVNEYTLSEWEDKAYVSRWRPGLPCPFNIKDVNLILIFSSEKYKNNAVKAIKIKLNKKINEKFYQGSWYVKLNNTDWHEVKDLGMGVLDNRSIFRPLNDRRINESYLNWQYSKSESPGIIFRGFEVAGYPDLTEEVNRKIRKKNIKLYSIEFADQKGFKSVSRGCRVVRLHSIPEELPVEQLTERIVRAAKERGIRAFYFKNQKHLDKLGEIKSRLEKAGFTVGPAEGIKPDSKSNILSMAGLAAGLTGIFVLLSIPASFIAAFIISAAVCLVFLPSVFLSVTIMLAAVFFPVAGIKAAEMNKGKYYKNFFTFLLFSISAGIMIASASALPVYLVKLEQIRGIKISLVLPLIISFFILYEDIPRKLKEPLKREEFFIAVFFLAAAAVYLARSSNSFPSFVADTELKIRGFLEKVFIYRPRFKEFLWGHPLLLSGLYFYKTGFKYSKILIIAGLMGQTSIINTFMHIHSPVTGAFVRTFWGILLGFPLGILLAAAVKKWAHREN